MPRYFFDTHDGEHELRDEEGSELLGLQEARDEAIRVLPGIARDVLPGGDRGDFVSTVRDERGRPVFRATLSLRAEWLAPNPVAEAAPHGAVPGGRRPRGLARA
jgi:hypothetical protein